MFDAEEHTSHEYGERIVPVVDREVGDRAEGAPDSGVVDHAVEVTEPFGDPVHRLLDVSFERGVADHDIDPARVGCALEVREKLRGGPWIQVKGDDAPAPVQESLDDSSSDTAGSSGDHHSAWCVHDSCLPVLTRFS
jgi:hypothetical protein